MLKRRGLLILLCLSLATALFVLPLTARALTWSVTFDGGDILNYTINKGTIASGGNPGNAVYGGITTTGSCSTSTSQSSVLVNLSSALTVTLAQMDAKGTGGGTGGWAITLYDGNGATLAIYSGGTGLDGTWYSPTTGSIAIASVSHILFDQSACDANNLQVWIDNLSITGYISGTPTSTLTPTGTPNPSLSGWNKPLRGGDQKYDDLSYHPGASYIDGLGGAAFAVEQLGIQHFNFNVGFSNVGGQNIYAVVDGNIDSVELLGHCLLMVIGTTGIPDGYCPLVWDVMPPFPSIYFVQWDSSYLVTETIGDSHVIRYIVQHPLVATGDTVTGGCLIGVSLPMKGFQGNDISDGAVIVQALEPDGITAFDLSSKLVSEPSGTACKAATNSVCDNVANPTFLADGGGWQLDPNFWYSYIPYLVPNGGLSFPVSVIQTMNLDSAKEYTITVDYQVEPGATTQRLAVALGTTQNIIVPVASPGITTYTFPAASYTPDQDSGLYTLRLTGVEDAVQTRVYFVCVGEVGSYIPGDGTGCIVLNPYFSNPGTYTGWVPGEPAPTFYPGMVELPDYSSIAQSFLLNPAVYDLQITYRRKGVAEGGKSVSILWNSDMLNDGTFPAVYTQTWVDATDTITIETATTETLNLTADGSDGDQVAQISKVCITPHEGGTPPGYLPPPPFQGGCRSCVFSPTGDLPTDFVEFQQWLTCQFFQLWECQAKILLRYIWQILLSILMLFGFFRLWLSATIIGLVNWGNGNLLCFSNFLAGHLNNLGITFQNSLTNLRSFTLVTGSGAGFWDAIVAIANALSGMVQSLINGIGTPIIGLLQQIVSGLFGLIAGAMGIIGALLTIAFTWLTTQASLLIHMLGGIINALYTAINATAIAVPPGAPMCDAPGTVLYYPCLGFYVLDNTIFSGPVIYIVPIFMALMSWRVLMWAVHRVKGTFAG